MSEGLSQFLQDLGNASVASRIAEKAITAAKSRIAAKKAKKIEREKSKADSAPLVGKLSSCTGKKPELNELFIVEGDSAGRQRQDGGATADSRRSSRCAESRSMSKKSASNRCCKTRNSARSSLRLGAGFDKSFQIQNIKYHKVIILADADQDGAHIRAILLTFFFRYYRQLITDGHVYIAQPPLYSIKKGKTTLWAHTEKQLSEAKSSLGRGAEVKRYKGLGEMSKEQLWETTLDPNGRVLMQVTVEDAAACDHIVSTLMGDAVEPRKQYISEYANFNKQDKFQGNLD